MTKDDNRRSIESQLNCKATGALDSQIADELKLKDKPLSKIIEEDEEDTEENAQE